MDERATDLQQHDRPGGREGRRRRGSRSSARRVTELVSIEYVAGNNTYKLWSTRPTATVDRLPGSETATIDIDSTGRMWLSTETSSDIVVVLQRRAVLELLRAGHARDGYHRRRHLASSRRCPNGHRSACSGRTRTPSGSASVCTRTEELPTTWAADEVPASGSALNVGLGDGRRPPERRGRCRRHPLRGGQDELRHAGPSEDRPARPAPERHLGSSLRSRRFRDARHRAAQRAVDHTVRVVYSSSEGYNDIVVSSSPTSAISFGPRTVVMTGGLNDATSTKDNWTDQVLVLASSSTEAKAVS